MEKFNKWNNTLNYSLYDNLILSKIPKRNTNYDFCNLHDEHNINIIIDLSTHNNSYDIPKNVKHYNFNFEKKVLPSEDKIDSIMNILNDNKDKKILIHCHYGFNRTGFVFITYLCRNGYKLNDATNIFTKIRGKGIKYPELNLYLSNKFE
jgi:protein-tyrosine phosphatase